MHKNPQLGNFNTQQNLVSDMSKLSVNESRKLVIKSSERIASESI